MQLLTIVMLVYPLVTHWSTVLTNHIGEANGALLVTLDVLMVGSTMVLLVYATHSGLSTAETMERLDEFKLSDAACFLAEDRQLIEELIVRWFSDGAGSQQDRAIGVHNFERFVRMDIRAKAEDAMGGLQRQWAPDLTFMLVLATGGGTFFDQSAGELA